MALRGINVVELAGLAPAPFCGMVMADFGASVTRVDTVRKGMDIDCLGNGKKSIALNLKHPKGIKIFRQLCEHSDILIEPFRKGVMEKLGLGPSILLQDNPRLIYARLTGYGQNGIYSEKGGHDLNYISLSGLLSLLGRKGENPIAPVNLLADFGGGGLMCALGILMAILERNSSGRGQVIDANMVEGSAYLGSWVFRSQHLPIWGRPRGDNFLDTGAHFYETYRTRDGKYMAVAAIEEKFYVELLKGLELTPAECPQFGYHEEGKKLLTKKFLERTQAEWCEVFDKLDACVTPVLSIQEATCHPHNAEKSAFHIYNETVVPRPAPTLSRTPARSMASQPLPSIGQHTEEILIKLKYDSKTIKEMEEEGIIRCVKQKSKL